MAITFNWGQSGSSVGGTSVSLSAGAPGIQLNDLLIAVVVPENPSGFPGAVTAPAGWAQLDASQVQLEGDIPVNATIFYKIADGSESQPGNLTFSLSNSASCAWSLVDYSGVDTSNPIDAFSGQITNSAAIAPSVNTTNSDDTLVNIWIAKGGTGDYHPDLSTTYRTDTGTNTWTIPEIMVADKTLSSSGATPSDKMTEAFPTANQLGFSIALNEAPACFLAGTKICTPNGEVEIERIARGDRVITTDGRAVNVSWVGRQTISRQFADPLRVLPIRIRANSLGENIPSRDLLASPDHAIMIDGILVHAGALVNGHSIVRETDVPPSFTYYHVELDDHSLILAENTPAETFIDNADRLAFDNWQEHEALYPEGKPIVEMPYPRAKAYRQVPRAIRERLNERGVALYGAQVASVA